MQLTAKGLENFGTILNIITEFLAYVQDLASDGQVLRGIYSSLRNAADTFAQYHEARVHTKPTATARSLASLLAVVSPSVVTQMGHRYTMDEETGFKFLTSAIRKLTAQNAITVRGKS